MLLVMRVTKMQMMMVSSILRLKMVGWWQHYLTKESVASIESAEHKHAHNNGPSHEPI